MLATRDRILNFIPQRDPMVMVHAIVEAGDKHAVTNLLVEVDNIFVQNGFFTEPGLIENIAQTAAAQVGYQCSIKNVPVPVGFIAAVKDMVILKLPPVGTTLSTRIDIVNHVMDVTLAKGEVRVGGEVYCTCEMRIFVKT